MQISSILRAQVADLRKKLADESAMRAHADFFEGMTAVRMWVRLARYDIKIRYRRTVLGPIWVTLAFTATFTMMAMLFSAVLRADLTEYLPYLGAAMVAWMFISGVANEAPNIFIGAKGFIDGIRVPMSMHVMRVIARQLIVFGHNMLGLFAIVIFVSGPPNFWIFGLIISVSILFITLFFGGLILALVGARYRDLGQLIGILLNLLFFMTPIIWRPEDIPEGRLYWVDYNPFFHYLEILRAPIVGEAPPIISLVFSGATGVCLGLIAYVVFKLYRRRVPYWL
jgi:ABC-type polysaccharide/polyol phosphate export permease